MLGFAGAARDDTPGAHRCVASEAKLANDGAIGQIDSLDEAGEILKRLFQAKSEKSVREILRGR